MSRLIRLYPPAWRDRYLAELEDLLADRPPTFGDRFDLVRGAIDAWVHPQLVARPSRQASGGWGVRVFARASAVIGGGLWIAAGLSMSTARYSPTLGYKESGTGVVIMVAAAVLTALASIALARSTTLRSMAASVTSVAMLVGAVLIVTPWPILIVGFFGHAIATAAFGYLAGAALPMGRLLAIAALILPMTNTEDERALLTIPLGLAWIAVGTLAFRRAPAVSAA